MRYRPAPAALGAVLAVTTVLAGCSSSGDDGGADRGYVAGDSTVQTVPVDKRREPVTLGGDTLDGQPFNVAEVRGRPVVINVWASNCAPCRKEAAELKGASTDLGSANATFVGLNIKDQEASAKAFERRFSVGYPSLFDPGGDLLLDLRGAVPPNALPVTLVLDRKGRIAARVSGATTRRTVVGLVQDVLKEPA
jgi:thiol-disulfide isomerase/thioredoxin